MLMKKFFTLVAATAIAALSLISSKSYGSHAVAADITYQYVGPNQYLLTLRFYRDCSGITAPTTVQLGYSSSCFPGGFITLNPIPGTGQEIPPSPCLPAITTSCNGGSGYGVQEYIFQGLVTLPGPCADWRFDYALCCRNDDITTVIDPDFYSLYVSSTLDNFNFPTNSSPVFANIPVTQFCVGNQFFYNQGATDIDGDSLNFFLDIAEDALGVSLPYAPGYSALTPLASSTPITIDPFTGTISFTPSMVQVGVIAIVCEEYRNGIKIGQIKRDIQMNVVSGCIGTAPIFADPVDPSGNPAPFYTAACGDTAIYIITDQPIQCGSVVPTDIRILTPQGLLNPVLSATPVNCVNGQTDSILVTFFYPLTVGTTYAFTKVGFDNNTFLSECGVQMPEFDSIPFNVVDPGIFNTEVQNVGCSFDNVTITFDYEIVCNTVTSAGSEFFLVDANGTVYPVTAVTNCPGGNGFSSTITFNLGALISPATPVYLIVQSGTDANTFTNRCNTFIQAGDTLAVLNVLNSLIVNLGNDPTICDTDPLPVLDAGISGATYIWTFNGTTLPDQTQTISATQSGIYIVNVGVTPSCLGGDTIVVTINPTPVVALGNDISICDTDPVPTLDAGNPGATYQWFENGVAIAGETLQFFQPLLAGTYSVSVSNGTCTGTDEVIIVIDPNLIVALGPDQSICSTDPLPVLDAGVPNGSYQWLLNGSAVGANAQTLQTTGAGTYTVAVTSLSGCTGTDEFILNVIQAPVVSLGNDTSICSPDILILDAGNSGATYQWSLNGTAISGANNQQYQPTQSGAYSVLVNTGGQCDALGTINVTIVPQLSVTVADIAICSDQPYPTLDAGVPGVNYSWTLNGTVVGTNQTYTPTQPGSYQVAISVGTCSATDIVGVSVVPVPVVTLSNIAACPGSPFAILDAGNAGALYIWNTGETSQTITPGAAGTYTVTVTNGSLGLNCSAEASAIVSTTDPVLVDIGTDVSICPGDTNVTMDAGNPGATYVWANNGTIISGQTGQTLTVNYGGSFTVLVTDANGCTGTDQLTVSELDCEIEVIIPNVFTPDNGDGLNDVFFIKNLDANPNSKLVIFNRWGLEVFSSSNYQNDWNGNDLPDGTYFYTLILQNGKDYKGALKLIRKK